MTDSLNLNQAVLDARGDGPEAEEALRAVSEARRTLARAFLTAANSDAELGRWLPQLTNLAALPPLWEPNAEDTELYEAIAGAWMGLPSPPPQVLLAAMSLA